jgi:hypothetical protein
MAVDTRYDDPFGELSDSGMTHPRVSTEPTKNRLVQGGCQIEPSRSNLLFDRHFRNLVALGDRVDHSHISGFAKHGVKTVEVRLWAVADEELTAASVRAAMGHGKAARLVTMGIALGFAGDGVAGTASTSTVGAATLDHKVADYPMEIQAIVKAFLRQFDEVLNSAGGLGVKQFQIDCALVGFHDGAGHTRTPLFVAQNLHCPS